jgi:hypothetical protein
LRKQLQLFLACTWLAACSDPAPLFPPTAPDDVKQACALTQRKCTQCHDRDRIVDARHSTQEWRVTVDRMRAFPGSAISPGDSDIILRCLTYSLTP